MGIKIVGIELISTRELSTSSMGAMRVSFEVWEDSKEWTNCYLAGNGAARRLGSSAEEGHGFSYMLSL